MEVLGLVSGERIASRDLVRQTWAGPSRSADFDPGGMKRSKRASCRPVPHPLSRRGLSASRRFRPSRQRAVGLSLVMRPDPTVWDGRYSSNAWLQECPKPVTWPKHGATRSRCGARRCRTPRARHRGCRSASEPERNQRRSASSRRPRARNRCPVALSLGYGRTRAGADRDGPWRRRLLGCGRPIPASGSLSGLGPDEGGNGGGDTPPAMGTLDEGGRDLAPRISLGRIGPKSSTTPVRPKPDPPPSFLFATSEKAGTPASFQAEYAWGDGDRHRLCIGCNACVVACQAENNVPVVGPEQIARGRDMHWLRVDEYEKADGRPQPASSRCPACIARRRRASRSARWGPRSTTARG